MPPPIWNWQSKVNRLRRIYEENALECTLGVSASSLSDWNPIRTMTDVNVSAESQWSTPTNVSETLIKFINYSDFEEEPGETYHGREENSTGAVSVAIDEIRPMKPSTVSSLCGAATSTVYPDFTPPKNKSAVQCNSEIDSSLEIFNCIPVLEFAKSNIVALIDDHIALFREKGQSLKLQNDERIKEMELATAQKNVERHNHIQRIRDEFDVTIDRFQHLFDELEKIS